MQIGAGKPDIYIPPETNGRATIAADSWALGATVVESLTQNRPQETAGDPGIPDSLPQPFLDIARNTLRRDPKSRWNAADISNRLNTKATPEPAKTTALVASPSASAAPAPAVTKPAPAVAPVGRSRRRAAEANSIEIRRFTCGGRERRHSNGSGRCPRTSRAKSRSARKADEEHRSAVSTSLHRRTKIRRGSEVEQTLVHRDYLVDRGCGRRLVLRSASARIHAKRNLEFAGCRSVNAACAARFVSTCFFAARGRTNAAARRQQQARRNSRREAFDFRACSDSRRHRRSCASFIDAATC